MLHHPICPSFISCLRENLPAPWKHHKQVFAKAQKSDLLLWVEFLNVANQGISINLLTYWLPDVPCWSVASLMGIRGYKALGTAWHWELPFKCWGRFTLNYLESMTSMITISQYLHSNSSNKPFTCILSLLDSTSWLYSSSFADATQETHVSLACHLASAILIHQACLYSQHIEGSQNIIAGPLSHDFQKWV